MELYKKYRPKTLEQVVGQPDAVATLSKWLRDGNGSVPHSILFAGPSGCGKTTLARMLANELDCNSVDFVEVNVAQSRGIDMVREIDARMRMAPLHGACRGWLLDEVHRATSDGQSSLLKMLEDTPKHVYFFLATTEPNKLLTTILNRCTHVCVKALAPKALRGLVGSVATKEKITLSKEVTDRLVEMADGSARRALVLLEQLVGLEEEEQLSCILNADTKRQGVEIARALVNSRTSWSDMVAILKGVDEDPEGLRRMILGYASSILLGNNKKMQVRASFIINVFRDHFFDCGRAGLVNACFEVINSGSR